MQLKKRGKKGMKREEFKDAGEGADDSQRGVKLGVDGV